MSRDQNRPSFASRRSLLAGALAATTLAACGRAEAPVDEEGRVRLRFATDWHARAGHGGFYQALAGGAYARRGLNVQIIQGKPDIDVPQLLASGTVELGMGSDSFMPLNLVAEGAPVKAVAAFFQKDPRVLLAHPDPALKSIADLKGRPFLLTDAAAATFWIWLKARYDFSDDQLRPYDVDPAAFIADPSAVQQGYLGADAYAIEQTARFTPHSFLLADQDYPSYAALVLAPNAFARDNATALRSFIAASAEGWRDYIHGDARAADLLIRRDNPQMSQAELDHARQALKENGIVDGGDAALYGLGTMTEDRWRAFFEIMSEAGVYPAPLNWREAFTTQYLPGRG
ncbi:ABC transporter substrate-binding protein [uncultured Brevundimonas sp.]|uniref:ABC transporter substrate-binding protein n=1 Tax=uncultured Brevundimonas sp. TaxID=213418 RepID=UPI0030ECC9DE|tara:strand:- start:9398 stop:10429 length:1032 start_codon:yes stop_codon:yes gene_type:complete